MPQFSVILTTYQNDSHYLPHMVQCLLNQTFKDFETILMVDGDLSFNPEPIVRHLNAKVIFTPKANTCGFRQRHDAIERAAGQYLVWLNVDNLIYPNYLQAHADNFASNPQAISVVNIHYWLKHDRWEPLPNSWITCGRVDLLNYSLSKELAKQVNAFGSHEEHIPEADWLTLERAMGIAPIVWDKNQPPVGCHF